MTKLNIPRLTGESEADFQRRYCREKMRIYRAAKPKAPPKARGRNTKPPKNSPLTFEEWVSAQQQPGENDEDYGRRSARERTARHRAKPGMHDVIAARARAKYAADPNVLKDQQRRRESDPERHKAYSRRHFERNRDAKIANLKDWVAKNPERFKAAKKAWEAANRPLLAAYSAAWRRECRVATPPWADFDAMAVFYRESARLTAEAGIRHHVDHIIPIRGRGVRGLHVQTNLRVIPGAENCQKNNKLDLVLLASIYPQLHI